MKANVCLVCLKTFQSFSSDAQVKKSGVPILKKFFKFAKNYLQIPSLQKLFNVDHVHSNNAGACDNDAFCESCELTVITPICQLYLEFLSTQLRLSSELEQLGKLLENSQVGLTRDLRMLNIKTLTNQLGIESVSNLEGFRSLLSQKCQLKMKVALADVSIRSRRDRDDNIDDHEVFEPLHTEAVSNPIDFKLQEGDDSDENNGDENGTFGIEKKIKLESVDLPNDEHYVIPENDLGDPDKLFNCSKLC